jgi:hypothetical protein
MREFEAMPVDELSDGCIMGTARGLITRDPTLWMGPNQPRSMPLVGRVDSWREESTQCNSPERQWRNLAQRN